MFLFARSCIPQEAQARQVRTMEQDVEPDQKPTQIIPNWQEGLDQQDGR